MTNLCGHFLFQNSKPTSFFSTCIKNFMIICFLERFSLLLSRKRISLYDLYHSLLFCLFVCLLRECMYSFYGYFRTWFVLKKSRNLKKKQLIKDEWIDRRQWWNKKKWLMVDKQSEDSMFLFDKVLLIYFSFI